MHKDIQVQTDIGNLTVAVTGLDHAHVSTASGATVTVRGKEYHVSVHLFMVGGNWVVKDSHRPWVAKRDARSNNESGAAPTIAAKVVEYCREALAGVLADDPTLPTRAEVASLTGQMALLTEERSKLLSAAGEKFLQIQRLYARRSKLGKAY